MTIKELLNDNSQTITYSMKLPKNLCTFLKYKATMDSEELDLRVTQVDLIKKAILRTYSDDIKLYLESKKNKNKNKNKKNKD